MLICRALFRNDKGYVYVVPDEQLEQIFRVFDKNKDGFIDRNEFQFCWNHWIKTVRLFSLMPIETMIDRFFFSRGFDFRSCDRLLHFSLLMFKMISSVVR